MECIICLVARYVSGFFQTGYLYGKYKGIDTRQHGGGNSGNTNALGVVGVRTGLIVFPGDFFKTVVPCFLVRVLPESQSDYLYVWVLYTGPGVMLGHSFPFYLNFKGGRGIAAAVGITTSLDRRLMLLCLATSVLIVTVTRYVSLGSLIVSTILVIWNVVMGQMGAYGLSAAAGPELCGISAVVAAMALWRHRANIVRPVRDKGNKIGIEKKQITENGR